jgi:hypothetical protein
MGKIAHDAEKFAGRTLPQVDFPLYFQDWRAALSLHEEAGDGSYRAVVMTVIHPCPMRLYLL